MTIRDDGGVAETPAVGLEDDKYFADNVKRLRSERGLSQTQLANEMVKAGWTHFRQNTISRIESGDQVPRLGEARALAHLLKSSVDRMTSAPIKSAREVADGLLDRYQSDVLREQKAAVEAVNRYYFAVVWLESAVKDHGDDASDHALAVAVGVLRAAGIPIATRMVASNMADEAADRLKAEILEQVDSIDNIFEIVHEIRALREEFGEMPEGWWRPRGKH